MKNNIKVSVCIPVYKVEKYIARCVRSLMEQTLSGLELIFVNDATPDNSIQVLEETLKEYHRDDVVVKIIHHEKNMGVAQTRMDAMNAVSGEYFIHCDPDDYVDLEMYRTMYDTLRQTEADMVYCDFNFLHPDGEKEYKSEKACSEPWILNREILDQHARCWGVLWNKMWKSCYKTNIKCPEGISFSEDVIMSFQMLERCTQIVHIPKPFYNYCQLESGICQTYTEDKLHLRIRILFYLRDISILKKIEVFIPAWQQFMIMCIRAKKSYGKVLFKNIPEKMKKMLTQNIYLSSMRFDLLLIKMAFISYDLTIFLYKIYGWIRTEIFRRK